MKAIAIATSETINWTAPGIDLRRGRRAGAGGFGFGSAGSVAGLRRGFGGSGAGLPSGSAGACGAGTSALIGRSAPTRKSYSALPGVRSDKVWATG
jgi:hypothetical protein